MTVSEFIRKYISEALVCQFSYRQEIVVFDGDDKYKTVVDNYGCADTESIPVGVLIKEIGTPIISKATHRVTLITKQAE